MKERPILFSGPMVKAILEGKKTQTRRVIKPQPSGPEIFPPNQFCDQWYFRDAYYACPENDIGKYVTCPYGKPGDRLWVRETFGYHDSHDDVVFFKTDTIGHLPNPFVATWKPSIHMPRKFSRITLEICSIRVERLQVISEADARAEGMSVLPLQDASDPSAWWQSEPGKHQARSPKQSFRLLWNTINAERGYGWDTNPFVWVIEFRRMER